MDNQDNQNCPINPVANTEYYSPFKESPYKIPHQGKYLFQSSPFPSNLGINSTPSKKIDYPNVFCTSLGETPLQMNIFSPIPNNPRGDVSYQKSQFQQKGQGFNEFSPFKPLITSPNQRISDKK